jgi:hypothetical protein
VGVQVILDFDVVGFHRWPGAPSEVAFLRHEHRHLFRIRIGICVTNLDREVEIFMEEDALRAHLASAYGQPCRFAARSCEHIATELLSFSGAEWVEVLEDGCGGARATK